MANILAPLLFCLLALTLAPTKAQQQQQNVSKAGFQQLMHLSQKLLEQYEILDNGINKGNLVTEISEHVDFQQLLKLPKLGLEYYKQFQNITITDLVPDTRVPTPEDLQCMAHMTQLMQGLSAGSLWAWKMIDSWGSIPSGILMGTYVDFGNFDECINIDKSFSTGPNIKGKYCFSALPVGNLFKENAGILKIFKLLTGICLPSSCTPQNMDTSLKMLLKRILKIDYKEKLVFRNSCKTAEPRPLTGLAIFTIVLLSILGLAMLLATLYDYFLCPVETQLPGLIKCFSARANSRALFSIVTSKSNPNVIDCLHGMRCLSLIWVIFGHDFIQSLFTPSTNLVDLYRWFESPFAMFVLHAQYSVDTFFFLSGLLVALLALRSMKRSKGKLNIPLMYLHRYLRLTTVLAVAILIVMSLTLHLGNGPTWGKEVVSGGSNCKDNWFWTLLYLQNYATTDRCLRQTWYLGVDMQLYFLSPIFLIALYKWGKKAVAAIVLLILLLSACLFSMMVIKHYSMLFKNNENADSEAKIYYATHTHAAPWLIGLLFGYFLYKTPGRTFKLNHLTVWVCWLLTLAIMFTCIFALYSDATWSKPMLSNVSEAFYLTFTRMAWPLAMAWVVFACMQGYGGMANGILSSPLWQPLSKLSYCIYIFHMSVQDHNSHRKRTHAYFSNYELMLRFWSDFGITVIVSYIIYITVEAPLGNLQMFVIPNRRPPVAVVKTVVAEVKHDSEEPLEPKATLPEQNVTRSTNPEVTAVSS